MIWSFELCFELVFLNNNRSFLIKKLSVLNLGNCNSDGFLETIFLLDFALALQCLVEKTIYILRLSTFGHCVEFRIMLYVLFILGQIVNHLSS